MVTKQASKPRTSGKSGAKVGSRTYTPVSDAVAQAGTFADNEIVEGMSRFGLVGALRKAMGRDRRSDAEALDNILVALLAWPLLKAASIHCFCSELCQFVGGTRRGALKKLLETRANREPRWHEVTLVLSVPAREEQPHRCWAIFLCTDPEVDEATVLRIYALRWSIEVYFKELKQHFGLLAEQSGRYQVSYASIHLAAIRYTLIFEAMLRSGGLSYGQVRDRQSGRLVVLCYAGLLWELFRALIEGALDGLRDTLEPDTLATVLNAIDETVESFLSRALQVAPESIASQLEAEAAGYL